MEAAACGLYTHRNAGELPLLIKENGVDAIIVPMNDSNAMADAVIRILTNLAWCKSSTPMLVEK